MSTPVRRLLAPVLLALALVLTACGGEEPGAEPSSSAPSPSVSVTPTTTGEPSTTPTPLPTPPADADWKPEQRTLASGRTYWMAVPTCAPSKACKAWKNHPRKLMIWLHGRGQPEIPANAVYNLRVIIQSTGNDVVPVYGVTAEGEADGYSWDADFCCALTKVDELAYLDAIVGDAARRTGVDTSRVGLAGASNGGLLATKAICTQPDRYKAIAIWAASWKGKCDKAPVVIGHWHGEADTVIRPEGGPFQLGERRVTFPPADWLESRVAPGSTFELTIIPGASHFQIPAGRMAMMFEWLDERL